MKTEFAKSLMAGFCSRPGSRSSRFESPYNGADGYVYGCDGRSFIRIPNGLVSGLALPSLPQYAISEKMLGPSCDVSFPLSVLVDTLKKCRCSDDGRCPECGGSGEVYGSYIDRRGETFQILGACPCCSGEGFLDGEYVGGERFDESAPPVRIGGADVRAVHLARVGVVALALGADTLRLVRRPILGKEGSGCAVFEFRDGIQVGVVPVYPVFDDVKLPIVV